MAESRRLTGIFRALRDTGLRRSQSAPATSKRARVRRRLALINKTAQLESDMSKDEAAVDQNLPILPTQKADEEPSDHAGENIQTADP